MEGKNSKDWRSTYLKIKVVKISCDCSYCKKRGYIWVRSDRTIWIEIPKNASANLKDNYLGKIRRVPESNLKNFSQAFCVIREPIERFKSMISHYFIDGARVEQGMDWLKKIGYTDFVNVNTISDVVLSNWDRIGEISEPHHWSSQLSFIPDHFWKMDFKVFDVSELPQFFNLEKKTNVSSSSLVNLSSNAIYQIEDMYKDDIDYYNKIKFQWQISE